MNLLPKHIVLYFFVFAFSTITAQGEFSIKRNKSEKIRFQLINNLIIIPVTINGVTLSFVLDTGVSKPILFNLADSDSLEVKNVESIFLHGLGSDGKIEALKSRNNSFKIGDAIKVNQTMYVVYDNNLNFGLRLGMPIHGIIGYDVFKDFIVEVNYTSTYIRLYNRKSFKPKTSKKWKQIPIDIKKRKPYLNANNQNIIKDGKKFTGIYCMLGSDRIYKINEGNLIETIKSKSKAAIPINKTNEVNKTISTDLIKIINKDLKNDKASENFTNELVRADLDKMLLNFYTSIPSFISQLEKYDDNKIAKTAIDRLTAITNDLEIIANLQISQ